MPFSNILFPGGLLSDIFCVVFKAAPVEEKEHNLIQGTVKIGLHAVQWGKKYLTKLKGIWFYYCGRSAPYQPHGDENRVFASRFSNL